MLKQQDRQHQQNQARAASSLADFEAFGTELTKNDGTMADRYGDGSGHVCCPHCALCITCGDCATHGCWAPQA